jgi:hypothetical protein
MTFGALRLQIQMSAPGVSLDLIDGFINSRYETILNAAAWTGLKAHAYLQTIAAYQSTTDTATATAGSNAVTGTGTAWTSAITGKKFSIPGEVVLYTATYVSGTSLTLDRPYEGLTGAKAYVFATDVYALPSDCRTVVTINSPLIDKPLAEFSEDMLNSVTGPEAMVSDPVAYSVYDPSPESAPPVLAQVRFWPPPLYARGYKTEYLRFANAFDGTNTSASPLPFIGSGILLNGVRADAQLHLGNLAAAAGYEKLFRDQLAELLRIEHQQRRPPATLQMVPRFTRHRIERALRGWDRGWGIGQGGPQ